MMGRNHCRSGVAAGLLLAACVPSAPLPVQLLAVTSTAGAALLPDIDHPSARVARSLGIFTRLISKGVNRLSLVVYHSSRTERDPGARSDGHRTLTHTLVGALFSAVVVGVLSVVHPLCGATAAFLLSALALSTLPFGRVSGGVSGALSLVSGATAWWVLSHETAWWWVLPLATLLGCVVHILGDWLTNSGVPLLWPLVREGRRWRPYASPLPFSAGDHVEAVIVAPLLILAMVGGVALWFALSVLPLASGAA